MSDTSVPTSADSGSRYAAFMSYARFDDAHDSGWLTEFRGRLSGEVQVQLGEPFPIFQDKVDTRWGEEWRRRIEQANDGSTFLLAVMSPSFFNSDECLNEVERFVAREQALNRRDLILPLVYIRLPAPGCFPADDRREKVRQELDARQYEDDLCALRGEPFTTKPVRDAVSRLAGEIVKRLTGAATPVPLPGKLVPEVRVGPTMHQARATPVSQTGPAIKGATFTGRNAQGFNEYRWEQDGTVMIEIPEGKFWMGSKPGEGEDNERPHHKVLISRFLIDKYPVTNQQYEEFTQASGYKTEAERAGEETTWRSYYSFETERHPVVMVMWDDAQEYCKWAGRRLPTEAEWEKAARGQDGRLYPWGSAKPDKSRANFGGEHRGPTPVGEFASGASPCGILDMAGNVWEWCNDWYAADYYKQSPAENPKGPDSGSSRVLRGGSWGDAPGGLRCAFRGRSEPSCRCGSFGFRCAVDA
jgi:formylglycine-generating enzyme required for sulfatase activity